VDQIKNQLYGIIHIIGYMQWGGAALGGVALIVVLVLVSFYPLQRGGDDEYNGEGAGEPGAVGDYSKMKNGEGGGPNQDDTFSPHRLH
jgi:hypothetical protein